MRRLSNHSPLALDSLHMAPATWGYNFGISGIKLLKMDRITGYLRMIRTRDWIKFYMIFPLTGAFLAHGVSPDLVTVCIVFICATGYGFVINNYSDLEIDKKHAKKMEHGKNPLACGRVTKRGTLLLSAVLVLVSLLLSAMMGAAGFLFTSLSILSLTIYSARPLRLKDRFLIDIICHGVMFGGFPFLAGFALAGGDLLSYTLLPLTGASLCTLICSEALIAHQINDYMEDLGNTPTTVVRIGQRNGCALLGFTGLLSLIALELIVPSIEVNSYIHPALFVLLLVYPAYACRDVLAGEMGGAVRKVLIYYFKL